MNESQALLAEYARDGSETAFREIVSRYIDLVYSTAFRLVERDSHWAEDVSQTVFADLARMAPKLARETMLGGWLHRHACFVARNAMRSERRRRLREQKAVEMNALHDDNSPEAYAEIAPMLDQAIEQLPASDRAAILLRFFEQRDLRSVGEILGTSENTARMRVSRALEKLHTVLRRRGIVSSAVALEAVLANGSVTAAPAGLAANIAGTVALGVATGTGTTLTLIKIMTLTKLKLAVTGAVAVAGIAASLVIVNQARGKLRDMDETSRQQSERLAQLNSEKSRLSNLLAETTGDRGTEISKLRAQAEDLRTRTNALAQIQKDIRSPRKSAVSRPQTPLEVKEDNLERICSTRDWGLAFLMYANDHDDQFPPSMEQAASYLSADVKAKTLSMMEQFEMIPPPAGETQKNPAERIVIREKQARQTPEGKWAKAYGFADGHGELHLETTDDFEAYERKHTGP